MLFLSVFLPLFALYLHALSPTVPLEDGGEMIRAACSLGVTHPPGYPLYVMLGRLALLLPAGDPAFRLNLVSALSGAAACGALACASRRLLGDGGGRAARVAAVGSALLLGTGFSTWWQSVIAEKYSFNLLLAAFCAGALVNCLRGGSSSGRRAALLGLSFGVWAGHHGQAVYFLPAVLLAVWHLGRTRGSTGWRNLGVFCLLFLAGISPKFLYPPVRAAAHPLHNWDVPSVFGRWTEYVTGGKYLWRTFYWGPIDAGRRLFSHAAGFLPHQFGWPGTALALYGLARTARRTPREAVVWASAAMFGVIFCVFFRLEGQAIETYYLPVFMVLSIFIAEGVLGLAVRIRGCIAAAALCAVLVGLNAAAHRAEAGRARHFFAYDFSRNILDAVPAGSILLAHGDRDLFPLWYVHDILGCSATVTLVDANYLISGLVAKPLAGRVQLLWPDSEPRLAAAFPFADILLKGGPGRPVYLASIFKGMEGNFLVPRGPAYRLAGNAAEMGLLLSGEESRPFPSRLRLRGVFSRYPPKDGNTQKLLSNYVMSVYWRGYQCMVQERYREAVGLLRKALSWPQFAGTDRAALHGSVAWCLERAGDNAGADREYTEALRLEPRRPALLKPFAALLLREGQRTEAAAALRRAVEADPQDAESRRMLIKLQTGVR